MSHHTVPSRSRDRTSYNYLGFSTSGPSWCKISTGRAQIPFRYDLDCATQALRERVDDSRSEGRNSHDRIAAVPHDQLKIIIAPS